jgi:hypothetical protein
MRAQGVLNDCEEDVRQASQRLTPRELRQHQREPGLPPRAGLGENGLEPAALAPDLNSEVLIDRFGRGKESRLRQGLTLALAPPSATASTAPATRMH